MLFPMHYVLIACLLFPITLFPQTAIDTRNLDTRIDNLVTQKVKEFNIPGYSVAVYYNGQKIIQKGYGFADIEKNIAVKPETIFGLASVTKTFTGLALLLLVDDGKVSLDDKLSKYYDDLSPEYQEITIKQLAGMTGGVPHNINEGVDWQQQIKSAQTQPLESKPGTSYSYSNLGFRILGGVIEKVSGKTYMEFLEERILKPIGMSNTKPSDNTFGEDLATPYNDQLKPVRGGYKKPTVNFAAGMLASNTIDLVKYAQALIDGKLLSKKGYDMLWNEREHVIDREKGKESNWAFGWGSTKARGHRKLGMNGGLPGVASSIFIYPDDNLIIIGLTNMNGAGHEISKLVAAEVIDGQ